MVYMLQNYNYNIANGLKLGQHTLIKHSVHVI